MRALQKINNIELKDISFGFPDEELIFEDLNHKFPEGKNIRVVGATGGGKSIFLKILAGLLLPLKGEYLIGGTSIGDLSFEEFTAYRLSIGYSFEFGGLLNNKTLADNILLPLQYHRNYRVDGGKKRVVELMERAGLAKTAHQRPSTVPGSHRKMTILLRAFVMKPQLLLLDEPTAGLTLEGKRFLLDLLREEREEGNLKHVIFCSNDETFIENIAETNIYLRDKKIISAVQALQEEAV